MRTLRSAVIFGLVYCLLAPSASYAQGLDIGQLTNILQGLTGGTTSTGTTTDANSVTTGTTGTTGTTTSGGTGQKVNMGTPHAWITAARLTHNAWNAAAFPKGSGGTQTTAAASAAASSGSTSTLLGGATIQQKPTKFVDQLSAAVITEFFKQIDNFLTTITGLFNLGSLFSSLTGG
jgi:hypothetical protein